MKGELTGKCLCGAVTYTLREAFRLKPYACHCTECQTRTGSAFSEHMLFMLSDLELNGDLDVARYTQPSGAQSEIFCCAICKARIYAVNNTREGMASLRCGTLDNSASVVPAAHLWVRSKQPWIGLPEGAKAMDEQPRTNEEWIAQVGIA
ncbi:GFA family protein [Qipengyuania sp. XHP0207]|uniref:GFA family protein n=1 Tax=Qipengyuania sp. XHP0207 TaxID=3038078 RepID=UPI00241F0978|nr:GFA family protein [Qipengyuania sp. XHP0207]MDG5747341.1 GFA family protein [Qipengyuania sp. XHP0207]